MTFVSSMSGIATITLTEALEEMERKVPFNVTYRKADENRKAAGERAELRGVILHSQDWEHSIRTVSIPDAEDGKDLRDIHIRLMLYFNGRRIIY